MNKLNQILIAGLLSLMAVSSANATLMMTVSDGVDTFTATDTDGDGMLSLTGVFGSWAVSANTAFTNPFVGNDYLEVMHLNSVNVSGGVGSLTIMLTDIDFSMSNYNINVGGTSQGTVDFAAFADLMNGEFAMTDGLYSESFGTGAFAGSKSGNIIDDSYSLTLVANVNHTGAGQITSFDFEVKIPEPAQLALLGLSLLLLGFASRKKS